EAFGLGGIGDAVDKRVENRVKVTLIAVVPGIADQVANPGAQVARADVRPVIQLADSLPDAFERLVRHRCPAVEDFGYRLVTDAGPCGHVLQRDSRHLIDSFRRTFAYILAHTSTPCQDTNR